MASNQVGTFVKITIGGVDMIGETTTSVAMAIAMIELSSKNGGNVSTFAPGRIAETISVNSIADTFVAATDYNFTTARAAAVAGTQVSFVVSEYTSAGVLVVGAINIAGTANISNVNWEVPDNDKMSFSLDLQVTGDTTDSVNS